MKFRHPCGCYFCEECVKNWAQTTIRARNLTDQSSIPCLSNYCQVQITFSELQKFMTKESMERINEAYNENYFSKTEDITRCPKENCGYAGFIKLGA